MAFEKASRRRAKLRMALTGVSGAGKTLGALLIAYGITGDWDKIALIDTEHERARFYANRNDFHIGEFLYCPMSAPFSPDRYKILVREGADAVGPDGVVIIDSLTHAWSAEGGVLDIKDKIASQSGKNSYTAWSEAGREQSSLVNTILAVNCHAICTMRSKMEYALEMNDRGKQQPVKIGLAPVQRDDTEYEFDIVLDIARSHIATASKDTTFLDRFGEIITPELGKKLHAWLNVGETSSDSVPMCSVCGCVIAPSRERHTPPAEVAEQTEKLTGQSMCEDCFIRWNRAKRKAEKEAVKAAQEPQGTPTEQEGVAS